MNKQESENKDDAKEKLKYETQVIIYSISDLKKILDYKIICKKP